MTDSTQYGRGQVIEIIHSVINKMDGSNVGRDVYQHIAELAEIIDSLKKEISQQTPEHVKNSHIPDATDELDAVIAATANATNTIMGICEDIENIASTVEGEAKDRLVNKVTEIYEACTFQDVTGQRIKKVVTTLHVIEEKVDRIIATLGMTVGLKTTAERIEKTVSVDDDKSLLNGPQMPDKAITQDDIDRLLAEFDGN